MWGKSQDGAGGVGGGHRDQGWQGELLLESQGGEGGLPQGGQGKKGELSL